MQFFAGPFATMPSRRRYPVIIVAADASRASASARGKISGRAVSQRRNVLSTTPSAFACAARVECSGAARTAATRSTSMVLSTGGRLWTRGAAFFLAFAIHLPYNRSPRGRQARGGVLDRSLIVLFRVLMGR